MRHLSSIVSERILGLLAGPLSYQRDQSSPVFHFPKHLVTVSSCRYTRESFLLILSRDLKCTSLPSFRSSLKSTIRLHKGFSLANFHLQYLSEAALVPQGQRQEIPFP